MSILNKLKSPLVINFLLAIIISGGLVYGVLKWLDSYTLHNQGIIVPDIKGLPLDEASPVIQRSDLRYSVIDSVYSQTVAPGEIVEVLPKVGSKVKAGRILLLTVNARGAQTAQIPAVKDFSYRQASATLRARGFKKVEVEYVPGQYKDLAVDVEWKGRALAEGERVPLDAVLVLKISSGEAAPPDSLETLIPGNDDEIWF
jgi:beta-lactam-binding protein with PASTA domain